MSVLWLQLSVGGGGQKFGMGEGSLVKKKVLGVCCQRCIKCHIFNIYLNKYLKILEMGTLVFSKGKPKFTFTRPFQME